MPFCVHSNYVTLVSGKLQLNTSAIFISYKVNNVLLQNDFGMEHSSTGQFLNRVK